MARAVELQDRQVAVALTPMQLRERVAVLERALSAEAAKRSKAEKDARTLANFIRERAGAQVWDHGDVMTLISDTFGELARSLRAGMTNARQNGTPASYVLLDHIVSKSVDGVNAHTVQKFGDAGDVPGVAAPHLLTERMIVDAKNVVGQAARAV